MLKDITKEIISNKNKEKSVILSKFFKTSTGQYGEGDIFLGITVPITRSIAKKYILSFLEIEELLNSKFHEIRLLALFSLIILYNCPNKNKKEVIDFYLSHTIYINNWDLVDLSCYKILGDYFFNYQNGDYNILKILAKSKNMWERRISIVSTMSFVKNNSLKPTIEISKLLLKNEHSLINKAVGWLLRELGKKDKTLLQNFLVSNIKDISNTTLTYAMEKFSIEEKKEIRKLK